MLRQDYIVVCGSCPVGFICTLTFATLASTPDSEFGKRRSVINKENEGPGSGGK